jgi:hypothetical protein
VLRREIVATCAVNYLINRGGILLLPRLEQGAKHGIGDAVSAWIEIDREAEAQPLRDALLAAGRPASEEQAALVEIEDALEAAASRGSTARRRTPRRRSARSETAEGCDGPAAPRQPLPRRSDQASDTRTRRRPRARW